MSNVCDFGKSLKTECNLLHFTRSSGIKTLQQFKEDETEIFLWRAGLLNQKDHVKTICHHHEQVFGNVFERRETKCCGVLIKHKRKVKAEQLITLKMAQHLKSKNVYVVSGQHFCRQYKVGFGTHEFWLSCILPF